jgi:uncharacterized protein
MLSAILLAGLLLLVPAALLGQVPVPPLQERINDLTGTLSSEQIASLGQMIAAFESGKGSQIAVLIVPTTRPEEIEQFAIRVAEKWKIGRKSLDDGVILVVAKNDRTVRIEAGYGLEGALTDFSAKQIISGQIVPRFRQEDFFGGIRAGVESIIAAIQGEQLPPPTQQPRTNASPVFSLLPILFFTGLFLRSVFGRLFGGVLAGGVVGLIIWMFAGSLFLAIVLGIVAFFFTLLFGSFGGPGGYYRSGHRGHYGGFGGFPGRGRFGSGGFSGGGGRFGGGGASGRW